MEVAIDSIQQIISAVVTWLVILSLVRVVLATVGILSVIRHPETAIGVSKTTWVLMFVLAPITSAIVYAVFYVKSKNTKNDDSLYV
ncbi:MAG: hypothetical protein E7315_04065 [Clostridiales bacterium]|nr:hypothetical protein [Clostridiales bacterium]